MKCVTVFEALMHHHRLSCGLKDFINPLSFAQRVTIQMKVIEKNLPVVLFIMLYKVVLTFEPVHEILKCTLAIQTKTLHEQYFDIAYLIFKVIKLNTFRICVE